MSTYLKEPPKIVLCTGLVKCYSVKNRVSCPKSVLADKSQVHEVHVNILPSLAARRLWMNGQHIRRDGLAARFGWEKKLGSRFPFRAVSKSRTRSGKRGRCDTSEPQQQLLGRRSLQAQFETAKIFPGPIGV